MTSRPACLQPPSRRALARPGIRTAASAALAVTLVAGCGLSGGSSTPAPNLSTITVAAQPGVNDAPLYLAQQDGLFKDAGLTVNIQNDGSITKEVSALTSGSADIAVGDYADFFSAQDSRSHPGLLVVADGYDAGPSVMEVLSRAGSGITSAQQLAHMTIGTSEPQDMPFNATLPYSEETLATQSALSNAGVDPATVHWRPMPTGQLVNALASHQVDAILATEPTIFQAESQIGATEVLDSCSGQTESLPLSGYFTLGSFAQKNRSTVLAFRSALLKAQADAALASSIQSVLENEVHMKAEQASLVTLGTYPTSVKASNLQRVASLMAQDGVLSPPLNVAQLVFH